MCYRPARPASSRPRTWMCSTNGPRIEKTGPRLKTSFVKTCWPRASDSSAFHTCWGGTSIKNVDCSGLVRNVYFANGVLLPRNASQQARVGEDLGIFKDNGDVDWSGLLPGDLLFWGKAATDSTKERVTHVACTSATASSSTPPN